MYYIITAINVKRGNLVKGNGGAHRFGTTVVSRTMFAYKRRRRRIATAAGVVVKPYTGAAVLIRTTAITTRTDGLIMITTRTDGRTDNDNDNASVYSKVKVRFDCSVFTRCALTTKLLLNSTITTITGQQHVWIFQRKHNRFRVVFPVVRSDAIAATTVCCDIRLCRPRRTRSCGDDRMAYYYYYQQNNSKILTGKRFRLLCNRTRVAAL